ncbi:unnamed protein product [Cuscuta campestris]|uniref:Uncharacterized protein n=1 Tax=Cuscuta campestris TaxID=132261 RepID=A0A484L995_9ASTE|nr:unnamed protein product [Cuscuta campestris]
MAGGRSKSKASKKKSTAEPSSSAPPPFPYLDGSFLEFGSEEELTRFLTHFAKRPISPPRVLPELFPQDKGYHDLDNQLQASGLWPFVSKSRSSFNPAFVRAFYSNLRREGDTIRSSINLYDIEIDLATFARVARLPIRGDDIATYGGEDWILNNEAVVIRELGITNLIRHSGAPTIHSAPPDKRLLLYIITRILRPRDNSHTSLFNEDLKAIHAIIHGASINWAKFVMIHMADCASIATERSLPYAFLVMDLIISADISIAGPDTKMTKIWIIQDSTFRKKKGIFLWVEVLKCGISEQVLLRLVGLEFSEPRVGRSDQYGSFAPTPKSTTIAMIAFPMATTRVVPAVIIGRGRVGKALHDMGNGEDVLVNRGERVPLDFPGPIFVCTRNDDLEAVLEATPNSRWSGIILFISACIFLRDKGIEARENQLQNNQGSG